ncbi:MAG: hypothetical protein HY738_24415 [Bacteroidia bacterium]|nr:hypothetical protein [Bacteroidia bacterium]
MLVNTSEDNSDEGIYLKVTAGGNSNIISISLSDSFILGKSDISEKWFIGWGSNIPLYDAGNENLRKIVKINTADKTIILGDILRGKGFPANGQRIVLWNTCPSGFKKKRKEPIINPSLWNDLSGKNIGLGALEYDSDSSRWAMFIQGIDTGPSNVYIAVSTNLIDWLPFNNGKPVFSEKDFILTGWAGYSADGKNRQSAMIGDIIYNNNEWIFVLYGFDRYGKKHIGLAFSGSLTAKVYNINNKASISPGKQGEWDQAGCFSPKIIKYKDKFLIFYDGIDSDGNENTGLAVSDNLLEWKKFTGNPVFCQHSGWQSATYNCEPTYISCRNDSIFLVLAGSKAFRAGFWHHYITGRMYIDRSGNVGDIQLGAFLSTDGGKTFIPHANNPVFCTDYSDIFENDHSGCTLEFIETDSSVFLFYYAKSNDLQKNYNIFVREKEK